jgi:hypothetical protein
MIPFPLINKSHCMVVYCIGFKKQFHMIRGQVFLVIYRGIDSFEGEP